IIDLGHLSYGSITPYSKGYTRSILGQCHLCSPSSPKPPSSLYALSLSVLSSSILYTVSLIPYRTSDLIISFCLHRSIPQAGSLVHVPSCLLHGLLHPFTFLYFPVPPRASAITRQQIRVFSLIRT
ncbi:hypothetical protein GB937_006502, partial [Aspergillus fischeri]